MCIVIIVKEIDAINTLNNENSLIHPEGNILQNNHWTIPFLIYIYLIWNHVIDLVELNHEMNENEIALTDLKLIQSIKLNSY